MNDTLKQKLKNLPLTPGVYFHKSKSGEIIYVGKAAVLKNRVKSYFLNLKNRDPKTEALIAEIVDTDWVEVESELDALFLEAEMIRRYMPKFNILLRDDKSLSYVKISKDDVPVVSVVRNPIDDGARYIGPYYSNLSVRRALKALRRIFPFNYQARLATMGSKLYQQIGLEPRLLTDEDKKRYQGNIRLLIKILEGKKSKVVESIEKEMLSASKKQDFETAAVARNRLLALKGLTKTKIFSDREFLDASKDKALSQLVDLLGIELPKRIEGFDISHMGGVDTVASMVVFKNGLSDKSSYRKFKMRIPGNDDFAHMNEVIKRRLAKNRVDDWGLPSLFLIDGGKGQLSAAIAARDEQGHNTPMIGLAKRIEQIVVKTSHETRDRSHESANSSGVTINPRVVSALGGTIEESDDFLLIDIPNNKDIIYLLQRIRDESHRFAVSYHSTLKRTRQTHSSLDDIPGIGPATKKKLLRHFGSKLAVKQAGRDELEAVVGEKLAQKIITTL